MNTKLVVYNSLTKIKEPFYPIKPPFVGIYLCGPTVYGSAHIGHARNAVFVDIIVRYLKHLKYRVRYVRNITDVGHLERDSDDGEDKIAKQAQIESLEPMEVVQQYTNSYRRDMAALNNTTPSIEPTASGHISEQIEMIEKILASGMAYVVNGSVYFNVEDYSKKNHYGILSGRVVEDLISGTRHLSGQAEKKSSIDFALWKKATPQHIMQWPSPWGYGYPGWHIECSAISTKYLGIKFDIHAGGMDLMFPHHECEIAQAQCAFNSSMAKYWMHNNMITINDQKMAKSLGNFITLDQLFSGVHPSLSKSYSPMTLRFFILQAHYRSTLAFSTNALDGAHIGYKKLINGLKTLDELSYRSDKFNEIDQSLVNEINQNCEKCYDSMNDDFNTAKTIAALFDLLHHINSFNTDNNLLSKIAASDFLLLKNTYKAFLIDILGLIEDSIVFNHKDFIRIIINLYKEAKIQKNYSQIDSIRTQLKVLGIDIKDTSAGVQWSYVVC
jgi:cysteinyl-tRNA synthetase